MSTPFFLCLSLRLYNSNLLYSRIQMVDIFQTFKTEFAWSKEHVQRVPFYHVRTLFGPCWHQDGPSIKFRPTENLKFWALSQHGLKPMSIKCPFFVHVRAKLGPCWDHVWPNLILWCARAPKFSRLIQHCLWHIFINWPLFGTMSMPCLNHSRTMFGLTLFSDHLELLNFHN